MRACGGFGGRRKYSSGCSPCSQLHSAIHAAFLLLYMSSLHFCSELCPCSPDFLQSSYICACSLVSMWSTDFLKYYYTGPGHFCSDKSLCATDYLQCMDIHVVCAGPFVQSLHVSDELRFLDAADWLCMFLVSPVCERRTC